MKPFYEEPGIVIYQGSAFDILPKLPPDIAAVTITDPPYSETTHTGARTLQGQETPKELIQFKAFTADDIKRAFELIAPLTRRWVVATLDDDHTLGLKKAPPKGLRFVRKGVWVKPGGAPQFTGDRPGQGWESIAFMHRDPSEAMTWHGRGRNSVFTHPVARGFHPTQKPEGLISEFVQLFTDPGDTILDPFMGSGTVLRVAKNLGRKAIGIERETVWCETARKRLRQEVLAL